MLRHRLAVLTLLFLSLVAGLSQSVSAQGEDQTLETGSQKAVKFDEFGDILMSDLKARLDNFAIQLQQQPTSRGFIIVYRARRDLPGLSHRLALRMKEYLVESRGLTKDQLVIVDGGVAMALTQELWVVPPGSARTPRSDARIGYLRSDDSAWKFFEYGFPPPERKQRSTTSASEDSDAEYLEAYATEVKSKPGNLACVIVYAQYNPRPGLVDYSGNYEPVRDVRLDKTGTATARLETEKHYLMKVYGIPASRIKTINGGYRKRREVELWIVPDGEPLPIPTPNSFPRKRKGRK